MKKASSLLGLIALTVGLSAPASGVDQPIPGKIGIVKNAKQAKIVSKAKDLVPPGSVFTLPVPGSLTEDPTIVGAEVRFFDTMFGIAGAGDVTFSLDASGWTGLGNPPGSKGYKYKGKDAVPADDICKIVLLKETVIKAICKPSPPTTIALTTPIGGNYGVILGVPTGTVSAARRYCAEFGGEEKKNDTKTYKHKGAPAPGTCPVVQPTPTPTVTPTKTPTPTNTPTPTVTNTPTITPTHTSTPTITPTRTPTRTPTNTPTRTPTRTPTDTPTRTPTRTPTNTPTNTPTPTPTNTPAPIGNHKCTLGAGSQLILHSALPLPPLPATGAVDLSCGTPNSGTGKAPCDCGVQAPGFGPLSIAGLFWACVKPPLSGSCPSGEIDCNGGNVLGLDMEGNRNIGACTSNANCATSCAAFCAPQAAFQAQCEGFCTGGTQMACTTDLQCGMAGEGSCNGPNGVGLGNICDCTCFDDMTGGASDPGELACQLAFNLTVESIPGNGLACDGADVTINVGDTCAPLTTQSVTAVMQNGNNGGGQFPPGGFADTGVPFNCTNLTTSVTSGGKLVGSAQFYASTIGDINTQLRVICQ